VSHVGRWNLYTCDTCGGRVTTVDRHEGTTPALMACRASRNCSGAMRSSFYVLPPDAPKPSYEWFRASRQQVRRMERSHRGAAEHHASGGLFLRRIIA
jgi:hypothetical protein